MRTMDHVKKRIIISMSAIIVLILTLLGITYAYFISNVKGNEEEKSISATAGILKLKYDGNNSYVKVTGLEPGTTIESKTFSVENTGTGIIENYDVILENVVNELQNYEDLTYVLECSSNDEYECTGSEGVFPINQRVIATNTIDVGTIHSYKLTLTYKETHEDQSDDMNKEISAKVNIKHDALNMKNLKIYGNSLQDTLTYGEIVSSNPVEVESLGSKVNLFDISWVMEKANSNHIELDGDSLILKNYANATYMTPERFLELTGLKEGDTVKTFFDLETIAGTSNSFSGIIAFLAKDTSAYSDLKFTSKNGVSNIITIPEGFNSTNYGNMYIYGIHTADENGDRLARVSNLVITKDTSLTEYIPYEKYKVPITIQGRNLFDKQSAIAGEPFYLATGNTSTNNTISVYYIEAVPNEEYSYLKTTENSNYIRIALCDSNKGFISRIGAFTDTSGTFTTTSTTAYIQIAVDNTILNEIQLEEGNTATEYEEYSEQVHNIYLNEPLRKVGDYADYIDFKNKTVVRNVKEVVLSGQEKWMLQSTNSYGIANFFTDTIGDINSTAYLSNRFVQQDTTIANTETEGLFYANKSTFYIRFNSSTASNVTTFKNWLNNNNTKLYVQLKSPVVEPINLPVLYIDKDTHISACDFNICASNIEVEFYE